MDHRVLLILMQDGSCHSLSHQSCNCLAFSPIKPDVSSNTTVSNLDSTPVVSHTPQEPKLCLPSVVAGYSDGTVRMFDLNAVEMVLKMHPHAVAVTAISFSSDGMSWHYSPVM